VQIRTRGTSRRRRTSYPDILCLDLAGQRVYLSAADLERVNGDRKVAAGCGIGQLERGCAVRRYGVLASIKKHPLGNDQPFVPCEKSPFTSRFGLNVQPVSGAVRPPSTTVWASANDAQINKVVNITSMKTEYLSDDEVANDRLVNKVQDRNRCDMKLSPACVDVRCAIETRATSLPHVFCR